MFQLTSIMLMAEPEFQADAFTLLSFLVLGIAILLFLIMYCKLHALIGLILTAIFIGIGVGMPLSMITASIENGVGTTLQGIALLVGLGSMFGAILEISGGVETIANKLISTFGEKKAPWTLGIASLIIAIPVFFDPAVIILMPIAIGIARKTKKSVLLYAIPLLAGLSVGHAFLPPTPGPVIVATQLGVDLGLVIIVGLICGSVAMICAGPIFGTYIGNKINISVIEENQPSNVLKENKKLPSFGTVITIILIPLILILLNTVSGILVNMGFYKIEPIQPFLKFIGTPFIALIISTLLAIIILGLKNGYSKEELEKVVSKSLTPTGMILLVTAGGGALRFILQDSGIGLIIGNFVASNNMPIMLVAFLISASVRIAVGSATVAMTMAAGIVASMAITDSLTALQLACVTMAIAGGATVCSHFNDSGFWLVKSLLKIDEKTTLRTWTTMVTINGTVGFLVAWLIFLII